jgi:hypothetical protein
MTGAVVAVGEALAVADGVAFVIDELAEAVGVGVALGVAAWTWSPGGAGLIEVSRQELSGGIAGSSDSGMFGFTDGAALGGSAAEPPVADPIEEVGWSVGVGLGAASAVTFAAGVAEIACGAGLHGAPAGAVTGPPAGITGVPSNGNAAGSLASRLMIGPNFCSSDEDEDDDPVVGFGVWTGRTGLVLRGARIGSDREAAVGPVVPVGAPDEESVGAVVVAGPVAGAGLGAAGVGASSSMGTPSCRAFSAAVRTSDRSSTDAMTTTGAELNSVAETPAATASGVWPPSTVVQSFGSWTPAALPPESPPAAGLAPPCPQAASVSVAAVSTPRERSRVSRRARVEDATEPPVSNLQMIFGRQSYLRTSAARGQPAQCNALSRSVRECKLSGSTGRDT